MTTLYDYEQWKARQQQNSIGAAEVVLGAATDAPDALAGDMNLASEYGKATGAPIPPVPMVKEYRPVFQQAIEREKNRTILSQAPRLTEWLRNPENATLARDDLQNLSWFDGFGRGLSGTVQRMGERVKLGANQFMFEQTAGRDADRKKTFGQLVDEGRWRVTAKDGTEIVGLAGPSEYLGALARYIDARYADLIGTDDKAAAESFAAGIKTAQDRLAAIPKSQIATEFEHQAMVDGASAGEAAKNFASAFMANPIGGLSWALETAGESAPQIAAALGVTVATRNPRFGLGVMGAGSYATERYTSPVDFLKDKGIDLGNKDDVARLISDPTLLREAADKGAIRGLIIGAFDVVSGGIAGRTLAGNPVVEAIAQAATQAISGSAGEYAARVATGQKIDWNEIFAEGFAEIATTPVDFGIAGRRLMRERAKVPEAEASRERLEEVSAMSQGSALRNRMPDRFRDFVAAATSNGPVENVYIPAKEFVQYFQGVGVDPYALIDGLEGVTRDDLDVAFAGGGDLQIPTATYAAKIAGTEHDAFLLDNMKFDPDAMSAREAAEFNERSQDAMDEAFEEAERLRIEDEQSRSFEQEIYDTTVSQLRAAGRSTDVATTEAQVYVATVRTAAADEGMTIDEYLRAYPLPEFRGQLPEGMQAKDVDALSRTLAEARSRRSAGLDKRQTLLEFISDHGGINDPGGELKSRNAEVVKRGPGKKTLKLSRKGVMAGMRDMLGGSGGKKFGVDDVAAAAVEAGFMADDPAVMAYKEAQRSGSQSPDITAAFWNAIDEELRGRAQFSEQEDAPADAEREAQLDRVEEYLSRLGKSLDDNDADIREAIQQDQEGRRFAQVSPEQARLIDMPVELPSDPVFAEAVANTPGATITDDGLLIDLVRYQKEEQAGSTSVRTGVFYLPAGSKDARHYKGKGSVGGAYGGRVEARGETLLKRPLFVKGATGGKAPEAAWNAIKGKGSFAALEKDIHSAVFGQTALKRDGLYEEWLHSWLVEHGADGDLVWDILANSQQGNQLRYALQENVIAHAVREAGYDSVMGYSVGRGGRGAFISEVFDVREVDYPVPGEPAVLHADFARRTLFQRTEAGAFGSIRVGSDGRTIIDLFQGANLSTVLHETGHYWLINLQQRAANGSVIAAERLNAVKAWWRENASDVAKDANRAMPNANVSADDVIAALDNGTTGDVVKDGAIDVGMQEQFARGAEVYFMEGKAPTAELRTAFEKFRSWLIATYRRLLDMVGNDPARALNVNVTDEIRQVFDRMIATDAEIAEAQEASGEGSPVFATAEAMGLGEDEYAAFLKLRSQAQDDAKARLLRETMEPIKRQDEKWFKTERAKVREGMEREVNAQRAYRAYEWMGNGRWLGVGKPDDLPALKLSKDILVQRYGAGVLKTLSDGRRPVYTTDGGADPDDVAGWFGFDSGDEMVRAIEAAPRRVDAIEAETDKRMRELHGDPLNDGSAEALALEAVHNDKRGQWLAAELKAVAEVAGVDVAMTAKEARASARSVIARMRVRDAMNANRFLAAERKAGQESAKFGAMLARDSVYLRNAQRRIASKARAAIRGEASPDAAAAAIEVFNRRTETKTSTFTVPDQTRVSSKGNEFTIPGGERTTTHLGYNDLVAQFVEAKRRQLLNHAFYMEARKVADEVEKAERFVAKLNKASTRERIAGAGKREDAQTDYLAAVDDILDRYDFRRMSGAEEERRGALGRFVEAMKAAGRENELAIPETVLADAARKPYKTVPVEELRGVVDSLKNLEHIALRWNDLIDGINKRKLDEAVDDILGSFDANVKKRPPGRVRTAGEGVRHATRQFLDWVLNASTILREIDGFKDFGPAYRNIKAPIDEAMNRLIGRKEKAATDLENLYSVYTKDERSRMAVREHMPTLGYALSKWERIAVALNTGNEGNFARLTDPKVRGALTPDQVQAVLKTLDERDADFVQSVWDYVGSFRADIASRERRTTGVEPAWVDPQPITIAGKTLRGGYYPLKYDPRLSSLARDDDAQQLATSLQAGRFGKAQTRNGHLQARAQSSGRDIELDMSVLHRHVNQVIYDLELSEPVANSWRILQNGRVRNSFIQSGKQADFDALEIWLKDVAEGELKSADLIGRGARMLKSNFTAAKLAFNLTTVAMQITGLSQSMVVVGKRDFARGVAAMFSPGAQDAIVEKSAFMRSRQTTFNKDIYDFYNDPATRPVASLWGDIKKDIIGPLSFWLMTKVQWHVVDTPTWLAGYYQGLRKFKNDEARAVAHADDIVKRAQASGLFSDRSAIERGSVSKTARQNDVVRLFTTLGSYMFAKFNVAYERSAVAARVIGEEGLSSRSAREAASWALDMAFLFTLEAVLTAAIKGGLPDDDDDDDDGWLTFLAKQTAFSVMATVPGVRDVASAAQGFEGGGAYGAITKEASAPFVQAVQGEADKALVKSIINASGLVTGLPSTQINRAVDAAMRSSQGEDVSPLEYLFGKSKK